MRFFFSIGGLSTKDVYLYFRENVVATFGVFRVRGKHHVPHGLWILLKNCYDHPFKDRECLRIIMVKPRDDLREYRQQLGAKCESLVCGRENIPDGSMCHITR
jgi:hypothetical protein